MNFKKINRLVLCAVLLISFSFATYLFAEDTVNTLGSNGILKNWLIIGPFPNPETAEPLTDTTFRKGFGTDYLAELGGESKAVLTKDTVVSYKDENGKTQQAKPHQLDTNQSKATAALCTGPLFRAGRIVFAKRRPAVVYYEKAELPRGLVT